MNDNTPKSTPAQPKVCLLCKYWVHDNAVEARAECRINNPMTKANGTPIWPKPHAADWCGRWKARVQ